MYISFGLRNEKKFINFCIEWIPFPRHNLDFEFLPFRKQSTLPTFITWIYDKRIKDLVYRHGFEYNVFLSPAVYLTDDEFQGTFSAQSGIYQCAHVTTECQTNSRFNVCLPAKSRKNSSSPSAPHHLGKPQASDNDPSPHLQERHWPEEGVMK